MIQKTLISNFNAVECNNALTFDKKTIAKMFKDFFSNLAKPLLIKLPNAANKYNIESVFQYYSKFIIEKPFHLRITSQEKVFKIIQNIDNFESCWHRQSFSKIFERWCSDSSKTPK